MDGGVVLTARRARGLARAAGEIVRSPRDAPARQQGQYGSARAQDNRNTLRHL